MNVDSSTTISLARDGGAGGWSGITSWLKPGVAISSETESYGGDRAASVVPSLRACYETLLLPRHGESLSLPFREDAFSLGSCDQPREKLECAMLSSAVRHFTDPDAFAESVRAGAIQLTALGRGPFTAKLTRIDLHDLWMQRFEEGVANVAHTTIFPGRAPIEFGASDETALVESGVELNAETLYRFTPPPLGPSRPTPATSDGREQRHPLDKK